MIVLLFVLQRDMATGKRTPIEIAWMVMATSVVACLRVAFMKLVKVLFQTIEAERTEHTRVPGVHTAEEALRELVRVNVSGRDFKRPLGAKATSMKYFDMSCSMRVNFISWRMFLLVA